MSDVKNSHSRWKGSFERKVGREDKSIMRVQKITGVFKEVLS